MSTVRIEAICGYLLQSEEEHEVHPEEEGESQSPFEKYKDAVIDVIQYVRPQRGYAQIVFGAATGWYENKPHGTKLSFLFY